MSAESDGYEQLNTKSKVKFRNVEGMPNRPPRLDYCQYLLVSPINHTLTNFADHVEDMSHDAINRFLRNEKMTPRLVWDNVREQIAARGRLHRVRRHDHRQGFLAQDRTGPAPVQRQRPRPDQRDRHGELRVREPADTGALDYRLPHLRSGQRRQDETGPRPLHANHPTSP